MTEKLFYKDQYQTEFTSTIVEKTKRKYEGKMKPAFILSSTLFYGTSGGQPNDIGTLTFPKINKSVNVIDVIEEGDILCHIVDEDVDAQKGDEVKGVIDWERRLDHMQQHHGQHILSATLMNIANIQTVAFHMSKNVSYIDLDSSPDANTIQQVQKKANQIIFEKRPVTANFYTLEECKKLPLRKALDKNIQEPVRIITIDGVDVQACCGTHPKDTSEVQSIAILGTEKVKKVTRLYFICGMRVVNYTHQAAKTLKYIGTKLNVAPEKVEKAFDQYMESTNQMRKQLAEYEKEVFHNIAKQLMDSAISSKSDFKIICKELKEKDMKALKAIAKDSAFSSNSIISLFSLQPPSEKDTSSIMFVIALTENSTVKGVDFRQIIKGAFAKFGGKGGGSSGFVQGNLKTTAIQEVVSYFAEILQNL